MAKKEKITKESEDTVDTKETTTTAIPFKTDESWAQYVMSKFSDDEMDGENPRVEGLRRVAELLIGTIVKEGCDLVGHPTMDNEGRVCAKATIIFKTISGDLKTYEALADAYPGNCSQEFSVYPTAMADTRAKGRCYRAALGLKRVIAAEEAFGQKGETDSSNRSIQVGQIAAIRLISDQLKVSITKLLDYKEIPYKKQAGTEIADLNSLSHADAIIVIKSLNDMRGVEKVPEKIKI